MKRRCKSYKMTRAGRRCASYGVSAEAVVPPKLERTAKQWAKSSDPVKMAIGQTILQLCADPPYVEDESLTRETLAGMIINDAEYVLNREVQEALTRFDFAWRR